MSSNYAYQERVADQALNSALKTGASIVGASCGSGKTTISHWLIKKFIQKFGPHVKILVVTENQTVLRDQYLLELENAHIPIDFSYGSVDVPSPVQVRVGIAANLHKLPWPSVDLVLIDEAHRHYGQPRMRSFFNKITVKHKILFTGSPSKFIKKNKYATPPIPIHIISGEELQDRDVYAGCDLLIAKVTYKKNAIQTMKEVLAYARRERADLSKVMVVCPSILYAEMIAKYLGWYNHKVFLSTSKNDPNNVQLNRFKQSESGFLVSVSKCSLGFNDGAIKTLFDLRSSLGSVDGNNQIFSRLLRKSSCGSRKSYFRISNDNNKDYNAQVFMLYKLKALMERRIFTEFDGGNLKLDVGFG